VVEQRQTIRATFSALLDALTAFFVFAMVTTCFHEFIHANVTRMLGGSAYVVFNWFGGYTVPSGVSGLALIAVAFSGGMGAFLLFLYFDRWWLEDPNDQYTRIPCRFFMINSLIYGLGEGLWMAGIVPNIYDFSLFASIVSLIILASWYGFGEGRVKEQELGGEKE
jgi:hypothetical protein